MLDARKGVDDVVLVDAAGRVIDRTLTIAQEELELARLELVEKLPVLGRDLVRLALAAALGLIGAIMATFAAAWLLADYVFGDEHVWLGFAVIALGALVPAALLALGAVRRARRTGPPVPVAALRQARALRETVRR